MQLRAKGGTAGGGGGGEGLGSITFHLRGISPLYLSFISPISRGWGASRSTSVARSWVN